MQMHELVDREVPSCLYCKSRCDFKMSGRTTSLANPDAYFIEILTCVKCKEVFEIHGWEDTGIISDFVFTCKNIAVINKYPQPSGTAVGFNIGTRKNLWPNMFAGGPTTNVPVFDVNFSDKKKLYEKLKTYLVFS